MSAEAMVSVIMPVYKCEEFIRDSILSVENQSYSDIELICINDGTPDNAMDICREMQAQYGNITILENEKNMGQEYTRNRGVAVAKGKYLLFLDSDDLLDSETIEKLVAAAEENQSDVVFFTFSRVINGIYNDCMIEDFSEGNIEKNAFVSMVLKNIDIGLLSCIGTKLYKSAFLRENNIVFDRKYKYNEDGMFFVDALFKANAIYVLNKPYYKYIIRESGSVMSSYRPDMFSSIMRSREHIKELFIETGIWNNADKQVEYYQEVLAQALNSLLNEMKYSDKKTFYKTCEEIREYADFETMYTCLWSSGKLSKARKLILPLIRKKKWLAVRFLVYLQQKM